MSDEHTDDADDNRVTAPQQEYGMRQVLTGFVILAVGLAITIGLPLVLA